MIIDYNEKKIFLFVAFAVCLHISAQYNDTWKEYLFGDYCSLSIPNTLELRDAASETGKFMDKNVHRLTFKFGAEAANKQIVFQPVGMNSGAPELFHAANEKYARVIVGLLSSGGITSSDIDNASASDIKKLNAGFYESYAADVKMMGQSLEQFQWYPLKRQKYSGKNALVLHFKRPGLKGAVDVAEYRFFMRSQQLRIVISYRESVKSITLQISHESCPP